MLKSRIPDSDIILRTNIHSEDFSSDRNFYNEKLLNFTTNSVINSVIDSEVYEYKPDSVDKINFNIFFLRYIQNNEFDEIKNYMEPEFQTQYNDSKLKFGLISSEEGQTSLSFNNVFETRQSNGLREAPILLEKNLTKIQELLQKPYIVRDIIGESTLKKPTRSGIPVFYNSFTFPFWDGKDRWLRDNLLYTNKVYFYNSFLFLEFYDSPLTVTQNRVQSIPIFINNRYNITEKNITKNFNYERPSFNLTNGVDGYSFFFLNNYNINEFYVRFSFWDALNGKKIPLIPSSNINPNKKWLQNPDTFNQNTRYLKYVLDYNTKTYKIYEYNTITNTFDTERFDFDLYELEFDSYYKNRSIPNQPPIDSRTQKKQQQPKNPLNFSIKNLHLNSYVGNNTNKYKQLSQQEINDSENFLNLTRKIIQTFNTYIGNINTDIFGDLPSKDMTLPVINRKITGNQIELKSFLLKNDDNITWTIRNIELRDINLSINGLNINNTYYNQRQSLWNEKPGFRLSEAITMISALTNDSYRLSYNTMDFTKEVIYEYLGDSIIFKKFLSLVQKERYILIEKNNAERSKANAITSFLDMLFRVLDVKYDTRHRRSRGYISYSYNPKTGERDTKFSEIYYYIDELGEKYMELKTNNLEKFNSIRFDILSTLARYKNEAGDEHNICFDLIRYIESLITPKDNEHLVEKYIELVSRKNITSTDKTIIEQKINQNTLSLILDKPVSELGFEPRDYTLQTFIIQNGDKFLSPGETNKIEFYFNIGEKINFFISLFSEIVISGRLRVSIVNNSGVIKNIVIPIKSKISTKKQQGDISGSDLIPKYKSSNPEPGSTINQLTLIK